MSYFRITHGISGQSGYGRLELSAILQTQFQHHHLAFMLSGVHLICLLEFEASEQVFDEFEFLFVAFT